MLRIISKAIHSLCKMLVPCKLQEFSSSAKESISKNVKQHPFPVEYLMNEFGFSLENAVAASKYMHFKTRDNPDAVVSFLKNEGFSHPQIRKLILKRGRILSNNPTKTLLPKVEFFRSKGVSSIDLVNIILCSPNLLERSLKRSISPSFKFFRGVLGSDQSVISMLKRNARLLTSLELLVKPNMEVLREGGVPYSSILYLLKIQPRLFTYGSGKLKESIEQVPKLGMDPYRCSYNLALSFLTVMSKSKWNKKMEVYKRWGCSMDKVLATFRIQPWIMTLSEEKINAVMSFCVEEMGWKPSEVVRTYYLLTLSLNKRIRPRWSVYQELVSKRLVKEQGKVRTMFQMKEELFLEKYVQCYEDEAPLLSKLYLQKMEASK